jgi:hypothetical protein
MNSAIMWESCPGAKFIMTANLPDHQLCFPRWDDDRKTFIVGYRPAVGKKLWGVIWLMPAEEMGALDHDKGTGSRYERVPITVCLSNGAPATIETYRVIPEQSGQPSKAHLALIIAGAEEHELPRDYVDQLKQTATLESFPLDFRLRGLL